MLIFDTDVISTFGKIRRLDLLKELFPNVDFFISPSVHDDLIKAMDRGYGFVDYILDSKIFELILLSKEESDFLSQLKEERKSLGLGEAEGISICKHRGFVMVTNDVGAKKVCDRYGITFIDLSMILRSLLKNMVLTRNEVRMLIDEIEDKDRVLIKDKDDILA